MPLERWLHMLRLRLRSLFHARQLDDDVSDELQYHVTPGWFEALGTPIVAGRDFTDRARAESPPVAVVNEAFARKFLSGASPLGRVIERKPAPIEIIGVAADTVYRSIRSPVQPTINRPATQAAPGLLAQLSLSVRSRTTAPGLLTASVAAAVKAVNPELKLTFNPLADHVNASLVPIDGRAARPTRPARQSFRLRSNEAATRRLAASAAPAR